MKRNRITTLLVALLMTLSLSTLGAAQSDLEEYHDVLTSANTSYSQQYFARDQFQGTPESVAVTLPAISITVNVFEDEEAAQNMVDYFVGQTAPDEISSIPDLGDEAYSISEGSPSPYQQSMLVLDGPIVVIAYATALSPHEDLPQDMIRFVLENGPGDEPVIVDADGTVSGGWTEAFPTTEDLPELDAYEAPTQSISIYPKTGMATPEA